MWSVTSLPVEIGGAREPGLMPRCPELEERMGSVLELLLAGAREWECEWEWEPCPRMFPRLPMCGSVPVDWPCPLPVWWCDRPVFSPSWCGSGCGMEVFLADTTPAPAPPEPEFAGSVWLKLW